MSMKKVVAAILCAAMVVSMFAGCGNTSSTDSASNETIVEVEASVASISDEVDEADESKVNYETNFVSAADKQVEDETSEADEDTSSTEEDLILSIVDQTISGATASDTDDTTVPEKTPTDYVDEDGNLNVPFDVAYPEIFYSEDVQYADNAILVKVKNAYSQETVSGLKAAGVGKMETMFALEDSKWYTAYLLKGIDVNEAMDAVRQVSGIVVAEYNYTYETALAEGESAAEAEVVANPQYADQWAKEKFGILKAWSKHREKAQEETGTATGGGSSSVVVAVIDTGVDYEHEDLQANMWKNVNEIPNNGVDDDNNGYVDDYYGVDITDPYGTGANVSGMDDNGHGTHVAGIIAAANNDKGMVGYAYNAKIMNIKAGDASGYFMQNNVANAIIYAYEHGADVINMSFGGTASTIAVQDALAVAYSRCVLVASAGNNGASNEGMYALPNYPAAFSYVLGVMSVGQTNVESGFTNYDELGFNSVEYEVYAPGEQIISTLPGNRYGKLSGTSMAAPVVSAQAALLRSYYNDADKYPTKFIYGQIVGTAENTVTCLNPEKHGLHNIPGVINFYESLTQLPKPEVSMSDYTLFDTEGFVADTQGLTAGCEEVNNGDGVVDAGETIALGFTLRNRWGMSENTTVHIEATSEAGVENPYVTFLNNDINYKSIGTYSENDCGKLYTEDGEMWNGWENPFYIQIAENCPNDYSVRLNITITCENGIDEADTATYTSADTILLTVRRGEILPNKITEDMTLTKDNYYIIPNSMIIMEGATVTVEAGTKIQFWCSDPSDAYADTAITYLNVAGEFICEGTEEEPVELFPSGWMDIYRVQISRVGEGYISLTHTNVINPYVDIDEAVNCTFSQNYKDYVKYRYLSGGVVEDSSGPARMNIDYAKDCAFYKLGVGHRWSCAELFGRYEGCIFVDSAITYAGVYAMENCVFYGNNNYWDSETEGGNSSMVLYPSTLEEFQAFYLGRDDETGSSYLFVNGLETVSMAKRFAALLGGDFVSFENAARMESLANEIASHYQNAGIPLDWYAAQNGSEQYYFLDVYTGIYKQDDIFYNSDHNVIDMEESTLSEVALYGISALASDQHCSRYGDYKLCYSYNDNPSNILDSVSRVIYEIPGDIYITDIQLEEYVADIDMESTYQILAKLTPKTADVTTLIYESQDESIVSVDENGLVTPVGTGSTSVRIYAPDYAVYNYITINVKEPIELESIAIAGDEEIVLNVNEPQRLNVIYTPAYTTKKAVTYKSTWEDVLTVDENGYMTGHMAGRAAVKVTGYNGLSATVAVRVVVPAESVTFEEDVYVTILGEEDGPDFYPVISPSNTTNQDLVWESSNPEVCYVDENGYLVKLKEGTAVLKATAVGTDLSDTITVAVTSQALETDIVKMEAVGGYMFALLADGTLWVWGDHIRTPRCMPIEGVEDFAVYNDSLYILDYSGQVNYYYTNHQYRDEISLEQKSFATLKNIVLLEGSYYGSFYALAADGSVWAWGSNSYGQLGIGSTVRADVPTQVLIDETVTDIDSFTCAAAFLTESGNVYISGGTNDDTRKATPGLVRSNVSEIYPYYIETNQPNCIVMRSEGGLYSMQYSLRTIDALGAYGDSVYLHDSVVYYISEGNVYVRKPSDTVFGLLEGIENVSEIYYLGEQYFFETMDGQIYAMGKGKNYLLGTGTTQDEESPTRIFFGLVDNEGGTLLDSWSGTNVEGTYEIVAGEAIVFDYSQALIAGANYASIALQNKEGLVLGVTKTLDLDKIYIAPRTALTVGEQYTITIPEGALVDRAGNGNSYISYTFTCVAGEDTEVLPDEDVTEDSVVEDAEIHEAVTDDDKLSQRHFWTAEEVEDYWKEFVSDGLDTRFYSNVILNRLHDDDMTLWLRIEGGGSASPTSAAISFGGNYWGTINKDLINKQILDFDDYQSLYDINEGLILTEAPENTYPYVVDAYLEVDGELVDTVGKDLVTFNVIFNRDMDTSIPLEVKFGSAYPYADYTIDGEYVIDEETGTSRHWQGTMQLSTLIENGYQYWSVSNGKAAGTSLKLYTDWGRFPFKIDTTAAQALTMFAEVTNTGINLTWTQDEFETLAGYNVYRSTSENGYYEKINDTVIPTDTKEWFDDEVMPGQRYYYNFTVVESDFTESEPSGKVQATAMDTMAPNIYHTPVSSAFTGSNLVINADVTDNVSITSATLYYRTTGTDTWTSKTMTNLNDKYSAIIPASDITTAGIQYYIAATDGITPTYRGTADAPYNITVQAAISDNEKGDIDGDGSVGIKDALMILMAINGRVNLTSEQHTKADLDGDGNLSAAEALRILRYANGISATL